MNCYRGWATKRAPAPTSIAELGGGIRFVLIFFVTPERSRRIVSRQKSKSIILKNHLLFFE